ncbi:PAS domain S-box protein [Metabacillus fastidiosus]|uniref:PAS domain S-box protein n=1 Tax=Metabacillus fastidiosus TaxID=1458 RepID=UPI002DBE42F7|nr:PAS domain S-box protein [Metabacillus fastidiosus]MEC2074607.1 PAS domain S-box protein [Metabacillus fastidiosus]
MDQSFSEENYQSLIQSEKMYRQIIEFSKEIIIIHSDYKVLCINQSGADFLRASKEDIIGAGVLNIILKEYKKVIEERIQKVVSENEPAGRIEQTILRLDGTLVDVEIYCYPVIFGDKKAIHSVIRDITEKKEIERKINEVSSPVVPLLADIGILPLVGSINYERATLLLEDLPSKVQEQNIQCLIIDFSGIYNFDEVVADYLSKVNSIMKLLGVNTIITGIRPDLAVTVTKLGVDLLSMQTMATVKQALHFLGVKYEK